MFLIVLLRPLLYKATFCCYWSSQRSVSAKLRTLTDGAIHRNSWSNMSTVTTLNKKKLKSRPFKESHWGNDHL